MGLQGAQAGATDLGALLPQDAIGHSSFLCPEKKLELGNTEEAFEDVDHILEGERPGIDRMCTAPTRSLPRLGRGMSTTVLPCVCTHVCGMTSRENRTKI